MGLRGSGSTSYSGELAAKEAGNIVLWTGMVAGIGQHAPVPGEPPPDREAWQATAHRGTKNWTQPKRPACVDARLFFTCGSSGLR